MAPPPVERTAAGRILVALDDAEAAVGALSTAAFLASRLQAELHGLYVEDIDLLRLAGLPFARTVGHASARSQPLDFAAVERAFRQQAERMRALMEEMAERERLAWSFQVERGRLLDAMMAVAGSADLLVFCRGAAGRGQSGPILVLLRRVEEIAPLLGVAAGLAREEGAELLLAVASPLREKARQWVRQEAVSARFVPVEESSGMVLAVRERARLLVIGAEDGLSGTDSRLRGEVGCPVVVVRSTAS
jgi:nucleotide-binding universal stress UspA family protein